MKVLELMDTMRIDLGTFICSIFYGNPESRTSARMKDARASFVRTSKFSDFLHNIHKPPRPPNGKGTLPTSGKNTLVEFAMNLVRETFKCELTTFSEGYGVDKKTLDNSEAMKDINSNSLGAEMKEKCPNLWGTLVELTGDEVAKYKEEEATEEKERKHSVLETVGQAGKQEQEDPKPPIKPHPHFGTIISIASLAYRLNRRKNKLQTILSVYAHAKHTDKAVHGLLHQAGILLSHSWTSEFVGIMAEAKHKQAIEVAETRIIMISHDNIRLKAPVQSQRGDNQSVSDNGTAITMYALPKLSAQAFEDPDNFGPFLQGLRECHIQGRAPRLSWEDISDNERLKRVRADYILDCLDFLRMVPGMEQSRALKSEKLQRVPGPNQLPYGKEHCTEMHMLPTVNIDESNYGGNIQVIKFTLKHLELLKTNATHNRLALERKIAWLGDQMTSLYCNGAQFFLNESENPIERLDPFIFIFGGFHCEMALGAGTFEKSRGTSSGLATFARDVILLSRTGLNANMNKKRPDFHTCDEFLQHELEARMRGAFLLEAGCSENELFAWVESHTADEINALTKKVYLNHASYFALQQLKLNNTTNEVHPSTILTNANLLRYSAYRRANKHGCVDRIADLLPELLAFFSGSGTLTMQKRFTIFSNFLHMNALLNSGFKDCDSEALPGGEYGGP
ncbi:hypothetical protein FRC06_005160 [Ceratobasidium sp. 370]|nr:hypothetical protein FRC06_005160 [Ceratobasidium sp. 370]